MNAARRPKDIGTATESAVVRYLQVNGFPNAERRALRGNHDVGDITGTPGLCWEVKGGDAARNASDGQIDVWLADTSDERLNAQADFGILVVARSYKNVRDWWAIMWGNELATLIVIAGVHDFEDAVRIPVRTPLHWLVDLLRINGYGQPYEDETETA